MCNRIHLSTTATVVHEINGEGLEAIGTCTLVQFVPFTCQASNAVHTGRQLWIGLAELPTWILVPCYRCIHIVPKGKLHSCMALLVSNPNQAICKLN
uniref:Uncharacterized protein n=1 Tax=Oryza meridionalis TaxID=40149 RepID=A0A0E0C5P5_9ORYZ